MNRLDLISELLRHQDIEGLISIGAPVDEYQAEAEMICNRVGEAEQELSRLTTDQVLSIVEEIWKEMFDLSDEQLAKRHDAFQRVAIRLASLSESR